MSHFDTRNGHLDQGDMTANGWKPVKVGITLERNLTSRGVIANRRQYSMRHVGSGTINKQTGNTINGRCAIEMSKSCRKDQIVVMLSHTHMARDTIIVGNKEFTLNRMWDLITVGTQWTQYIEKLLERMSVGGTAPSTGGNVLDVLEVYPYRISTRLRQWFCVLSCVGEGLKQDLCWANEEHFTTSQRTQQGMGSHGNS